VEVTLIAYTPNPEDVLAEAVSECYQSKPSVAAVRNCIARGHTSVLEHGNWTFKIKGVSRSLLAQLTRHRIGVSPTAQSQRYVKQYDVEYIVPPSIMLDSTAAVVFGKALDQIDYAYAKLIELGIPQEDARYILPNACPTSLVLTMNLRSLMHLWKLRCDQHAQWEVRGLAERIRDMVLDTLPSLKDIILEVLDSTRP
jgi:thymidylate synthase (FAD)